MWFNVVYLYFWWPKLIGYIVISFYVFMFVIPLISFLRNLGDFFSFPLAKYFSIRIRNEWKTCYLAFPSNLSCTKSSNGVLKYLPFVSVLESWFFNVLVIFIGSLRGKQVHQVPAELTGGLQNILALLDSGQYNPKECSSFLYFQPKLPFGD